MTTLPNMGLTLPERGAAGSGEWHDTMDANYALEDAHDHTTGKGARVPTAGININADLTFGGVYAPINLHRITFSSVAALSSNNKSLFVSSADNELYWRSNVGTNVKLTNGAALNVAAFTGGIGGDYAAVGAAVAYDDAADRYTFKQQSPGNWARLACGPVRLFEFNTTESVYVEMAAPAALGASYTVTWPTALPASEQPVSVGSTGQLIFGHGDRVLSMTALAAAGQSGATWTTGIAGSAGYAVSAGASTLVVPIELVVGDRIKSLSFKVFGDGAADLDTTVYSVDSAMAGSSIGTNTTTNQPASWSTVTIDVTDTTVASLTSIQIHFVASAANIRIGNISVTYDHP